MEGLLLFIFGYFLFLLLWLVVVLLFYALSFVFRKNLSSIPVGIVYLITFGIQIYLVIYALYLLWQIISSHEWLLLGLALIGGGFFIGWWQIIYGLLMTPFNVLASNFEERIEKADFSDKSVAGEVMDKEGKVVGVSEGQTSLQTRFAKYFLILYLFNVINLFIFPVERIGLAPIDYITKPFLQIIGLTVLIGIPYSIFRKVKYGQFLTNDKRYFLIQAWKIYLYIFVPITIGIFVLALLTNTL